MGLACAGSRTPDERDAVKSTISRYVTAFRSGHARAACALLSARERRKIARNARDAAGSEDEARSARCETLVYAVRELYDGSFTINEIRIRGDHAKARATFLPADSHGNQAPRTFLYALQKQGQRWIIDDQRDA
jgi:hypothetical protein